MEVGPTTHYIMGGVHVDARYANVARAGLVRRRRMRRWNQRRKPPGWQFALRSLVFGKRAGEFAAKFAKENSLGKIGPPQAEQIESAAREALAPFERSSSESPYQVQKDLQDTMQDLVGIVRNESEMRARPWGRSMISKSGLKTRRSAVIGNTIRVGTPRLI